MARQGIKATEQLWASSPAFKPQFSLDSQPFWATVLVLIALISTSIFMVTEKKSISGIARSSIAGLVASLAFGFGSVFLLDSVGVYV
ncbi:dolichyl-diphosphooligosaccharide--protein glycosyltransferase subunit Ost5p [Trichomonascus vanleenenianus]|uniref:OST5 family protein n=1 Tax=Trichomonascus vanleenenianus TaxID=2268995 RepID=UPI003EC97AA0